MRSWGACEGVTPADECWSAARGKGFFKKVRNMPLKVSATQPRGEGLVHKMCATTAHTGKGAPLTCFQAKQAKNNGEGSHKPGGVKMRGC